MHDEKIFTYRVSPVAKLGGTLIVRSILRNSQNCLELVRWFNLVYFRRVTSPQNVSLFMCGRLGVQYAVALAFRTTKLFRSTTKAKLRTATHGN